MDPAKDGGDFPVIGIAGLFLTLHVARRGRVAIITKKQRAESSTDYAQGASRR